MHVTIVTIGSRGDVEPYIALGRGLQAAGYHMRLATHTDFGPMIRSLGLDFSPIGVNMHEMMQFVTARYFDLTTNVYEETFRATTKQTHPHPVWLQFRPPSKTIRLGRSRVRHGQLVFRFLVRLAAFTRPH